MNPPPEAAIHPVAMTVAGSDSGGGAGIQADLRAFQAFGVYGTTAITAVTAQNPGGVRTIAPIDPAVVRDQMEAVFDVFEVRAVKTGMLFSRRHIETAAEVLRGRRDIPLVVDPVMVATSGDHLLEDNAVETLCDELLPLAALITPNLPEAGILLSEDVAPVEVRARIAEELALRYDCAVLLKGGHDAQSPGRDFLLDEDGGWWIESPIANEGSAHGSGCSVSAAVAAALARGHALRSAITQAKAYVYGALRNQVRLSKDTSAMWPSTPLPISDISVTEHS